MLRINCNSAALLTCMHMIMPLFGGTVLSELEVIREVHKNVHAVIQQSSNQMSLQQDLFNIGNAHRVIMARPHLLHFPQNHIALSLNGMVL